MAYRHLIICFTVLGHPRHLVVEGLSLVAVSDSWGGALGNCYEDLCGSNVSSSAPRSEYLQQWSDPSLAHRALRAGNDQTWSVRDKPPGRLESSRRPGA